MKTCKSFKRDGKSNKSGTASFEGLNELLRRHEAQAKQFAYNLAGSMDEADELVQQACYRALKYWRTYDPVKSFQSWYLTVVKNLFLDARRRARAVSLDAPMAGDSDLTLGDSLGDGEPMAEQQIEASEATAAVRRAVLALKRTHRKVVTLCDLEGVSYENAARMMGVKVGTVRSRLFRARASLRRSLDIGKVL